MENQNNLENPRTNAIDRYKYELENALASALSEWFETGHVSVEKYQEEFHDAILSQGAIDWRQIFNGKLSRHWLVHQGHTKTAKGRLRMDYIWGASIVEKCLQMMIELWEMRKEEVYGKEEGTKQQIRKEKAATRVQALHKLQETARPSDAKLFYADVKKTNRNINGGNTRRICCHEDKTNS